MIQLPEHITFRFATNNITTTQTSGNSAPLAGTTETSHAAALAFLALLIAVAAGAFILGRHTKNA